MLSVNEAIAALATLDGTNVEIHGLLSLEFEGTCLAHMPREERQDDSFASSIWVEFLLKKRGGPREGISSLDGKHVWVRGRLKGPKDGFGGCGHFSMWPAALTITNIKRYEPDAPGE